MTFSSGLGNSIEGPRVGVAQGRKRCRGEGSGVPPASIESLRARDHEIARPAKPIGGAQAIWIDWQSGVLTGASEPRNDGCALGY